jgi:hypothetical protein
MAATTRRLGAALAVAAVLGIAGLARRDYRAWIALGEGGIAPGARGWLKVTALRMTAGDPTDLSRLPAGSAQPGLRNLPWRTDPRPRVGAHPIPHRQLDQESPASMVTALDNLFAALLERYAPAVVERESGYEKHHPALFADALVSAGASPTGEIAHYHRPQGSMHLHMRPEDARVVIARGWGELHGLSGKAGLPRSYAMIYAPRDQEELNVIEAILAATIEWATT